MTLHIHFYSKYTFKNVRNLIDEYSRACSNGNVTELLMRLILTFPLRSEHTPSEAERSVSLGDHVSNMAAARG